MAAFSPEMEPDEWNLKASLLFLFSLSPGVAHNFPVLFFQVLNCETNIYSAWRRRLQDFQSNLIVHPHKRPNAMTLTCSNNDSPTSLTPHHLPPHADRMVSKILAS